MDIKRLAKIDLHASTIVLEEQTRLEEAKAKLSQERMDEYNNLFEKIVKPFEEILKSLISENLYGLLDLSFELRETFEVEGCGYINLAVGSFYYRNVLIELIHISSFGQVWISANGQKHAFVYKKDKNLEEKLCLLLDKIKKESVPRKVTINFEIAAYDEKSAMSYANDICNMFQMEFYDYSHRILNELVQVIRGAYIDD